MTARKLPWVSSFYLLAIASRALCTAFQLSVRSLKINFSWSFPDTELLFLEALGSKSSLARGQTKPHFTHLWKFQNLFHLSLQGIIFQYIILKSVLYVCLAEFLIK